MSEERTGVIYTIELDADGNVVRFESRPVKEKKPSKIHGSWKRVLCLILLISGAALILMGVLTHSFFSSMIRLRLLAAGTIIFLLGLFILIREISSRGKWIYYQDFLNDWIVDSRRGKGLKYHDRPGCYVITVYDNPLKSFDEVMNYENVYVGQSVNVYQRVHNHFSARGNGNVYGDIKDGKYVYVKIFPCREKELNDREKSLIGAYHAMAGYNRTGGGAAVR